MIRTSSTRFGFIKGTAGVVTRGCLFWLAVTSKGVAVFFCVIFLAVLKLCISCTTKQTNKQNKMLNSYNKNERGFTKFNANAESNKDAMRHHVARIYMMTQEERGRFISYEQALNETDY